MRVSWVGHFTNALVDRRDQTMTALLTGIVVVLVICHFPKAMMNVYECYQVIMSLCQFHQPTYFKWGGEPVLSLSWYLYMLWESRLCVSFFKKDNIFTKILMTVTRMMMLQNKNCQYNYNQSFIQRIYYGDLAQLKIPLWARIVIKISHLLLGVSSASNIIIYSYQVNVITDLTITITITRTSTSGQS